MDRLSNVDIIAGNLLEKIMPWYENLQIELKILAPKKLK